MRSYVRDLICDVLMMIGAVTVVCWVLGAMEVPSIEMKFTPTQQCARPAP